MKIYVSDKYNETLKNKTIIHTPRGCGKEFENYLKIVKEFKKNNQNLMFIFSERNLEQHEEEIRKQERLKVITELKEWVEKASNNYISKFDINGQDALFLVKQKLNEMKGENK